MGLQGCQCWQNGCASSFREVLQVLLQQALLLQVSLEQMLQ